MFGPKDTMLTLKNAPKSVSNKTCLDTDFDRPKPRPMTPCRAYLKLRWRYIGPLLCLYVGPMLGSCYWPIFTTLRNFGNLQKPWKNTIYDTILGLSWAFVQRIFTYVGSMLALYNAMSGPPGVHRTLCQDHVRPMLDPKYALKSVSNKTCFWYGLWPPWKLPYDTLSRLS